MQRIVRNTGPKGNKTLTVKRGPFLTEAEVFDGGTGVLVVELFGTSMRMRMKGRRKGELILNYASAWSFAWKQQMLERAKAKKAAKKAGGK